MSALAVIQGSYADLKIVRTRQAVQIIVECPLERLPEIVAAFGAPNPAAEIPVAVARLNETASDEAPSREGHMRPVSSMEEPGAQGEGASLSVREGNRPVVSSPAPRQRTLAEDVYLVTRQGTFWLFMQQQFPGEWALARKRYENDERSNRDTAELAVKIYCRVESKRDIVAGGEAAQRWGTIEAEYVLWQQRRAA